MISFVSLGAPDCLTERQPISPIMGEVSRYAASGRLSPGAAFLFERGRWRNSSTSRSCSTGSCGTQPCRRKSTSTSNVGAARHLHARSLTTQNDRDADVTIEEFLEEAGAASHIRARRAGVDRIKWVRRPPSLRRVLGNRATSRDAPREGVEIPWAARIVGPELGGSLAKVWQHLVAA